MLVARAATDADFRSVSDLVGPFGSAVRAAIRIDEDLYREVKAKAARSGRTTDPVQFPALGLDPTGLVARTLPLKPGQGSSMSNAAYDPAGALQLEDNPIQAGRAFTDAGVDLVSVSQTTVCQAKDPASAARRAQALADDTATRRRSSWTATEPLPAHRRFRRPGSP